MIRYESKFLFVRIRQVITEAVFQISANHMAQISNHIKGVDTRLVSIRVITWALF